MRERVGASKRAGHNLLVAGRVRRREAIPSTPAVAAAVAASIAGCGLLVCSLVAGLDGWRASGGLAGVGGMAVVLGAVGLRRYRVARRESTAAAFAAMLGALLVQIGVSTMAYLATGTFSRLDDAVFESAAGYTTTALSAVADPQVLPDGVALWRALTQWSGGLTALVVVVTLVPALGVATRGDADRGIRPRHLGLASRQAMHILDRLFRLYVVLTLIGAALFLLAGMDPFDAMTYALTTVSSGGMAHHADSLAHFDSSAVEWAGIGGMFLAGINLAVVFRSARGLVVGSVLRSVELRAFVALIVGATGAVLITGDLDGSLVEQVRHGLFSVVSMASTTGHTVVDWTTWGDGAQVALIVVAGVGAMAGAIGGGFRVARLMALLAFMRREVVRQIHPTAVQVVKVGRRTVDDVLVDRIVGYQILYLFVGGAGAVGLALGGASLTAALSGAVSALSTAGPALGELGPAGGALELPAPGRAALIPLMLLGRLELAPVLVGALMLFGERRRR